MKKLLILLLFLLIAFAVDAQGKKDSIPIDKKWHLNCGFSNSFTTAMQIPSQISSQFYGAPIENYKSRYSVILPAISVFMHAKKKKFAIKSELEYMDLLTKQTYQELQHIAYNEHFTNYTKSIWWYRILDIKVLAGLELKHFYLYSGVQLGYTLNGSFDRDETYPDWDVSWGLHHRTIWGSITEVGVKFAKRWAIGGKVFMQSYTNNKYEDFVGKKYYIHYLQLSVSCLIRKKCF